MLALVRVVGVIKQRDGELGLINLKKRMYMNKDFHYDIDLTKPIMEFFPFLPPII